MGLAGGGALFPRGCGAGTSSAVGRDSTGGAGARDGTAAGGGGMGLTGGGALFPRGCGGGTSPAVGRDSTGGAGAKCSGGAGGGGAPTILCPIGGRGGGGGVIGVIPGIFSSAGMLCRSYRIMFCAA